MHQSTKSAGIKQQLTGGTSFEGGNGDYAFGPYKRIGLDASRLGPFIPARP